MVFRNLLFLAASATAGGFLALGSAQPAQAELVKNGGFSLNSINGNFNSSFLNGNQGVTIADWAMSNSYSFIVADGNSVTTNLNQSGNGPDPIFGTPITGVPGFPLGLYSTGQSVTSPTGSGWFLVSNGSYGADVVLTQTVTGFTVGQEYVLSFYQAGGQQQGFTGDSTAFWQVKLGADSFNPPVIGLTTQGAVTPWAQITQPFTASATSLVLEFRTDGAPSGNSPFALLTGVSIVESAAPPSPSVPGPLPLVGAGMTLAWSRKLRRRIAVSARREAGPAS